jgi:uroporphyrinogen decarboxylase
MAEELTHKQRIDLMLQGREIDRPPVSVWRHFYDRENTKDDLVRSMVGFQEEFDWDFIKINSRASYHVEDWGVKVNYSDDPMKKPVSDSFPVVKTDDWEKIKPLDWRKGALGEILEAGEEIVSLTGDHVYCLPTIFSPLSIAADLVESDERFVSLMLEDPGKLHGALEAIAETFSGYVADFIDREVAGIFFATTEWASRDRMTEEQYLEFGRPYDLRVLNSASRGFFNIAHVCKSNNMLPLFRDYPVQVLSWNPFERGNLSIGQAAQITDKVFLTGVDQNGALRSGTESEIKKQIDDSIAEMLFGRLIVAPGCAVKVDTPENSLRILANHTKGRAS